MKCCRVLLLTSMMLHAEDNAPHIQAALRAYRAGEAELQHNKPESAAADFESAIRIEPTFLSAFEGLVAANLAAGDRLKASATLTRLLQIEPEDRPRRLQLAQLLLDESQWKRALAQFGIVLKEDPDDADALAGFADAAQKLGMSSEAQEARARGRQTHPEDSRFAANHP